MTVRFYKPFGVLCQFTDASGRTTLADFVQIPNIYAAGRLDQDSEGLLILTSDGQVNAAITQPRHELQKTYLVQVEGIPSEESLQLLRVGVKLNDGLTLPAHVKRIEAELDLAPRDPPIRVRKAIPTCWLQISIHEGRNRQVRRMTAAVGHPTLRLVRTHIGPISLEGLQPGEFQEIHTTDVEEILKYRNPTAGKKSDGASSKNNGVHVGGSRRKGNRSAARRMDGGSRRI